jgi:hypothetical protein
MGPSTAKYQSHSTNDLKATTTASQLNQWTPEGTTESKKQRYRSSTDLAATSRDHSDERKTVKHRFHSTIGLVEWSTSGHYCKPLKSSLAREVPLQQG